MKRLDWVDILKGIGILYVLIGHIIINENSLLKVYIYSFHMPLFFFISGYLFKVNSTYLSHIKKRLKTLLIPYTTFFIFSYIVTRILFKLSLLETLVNKYELIKIFVVANGFELNKINNTPLWFLPCLFITENVFFLISKTKKLRLIFILSLLISIAGYILTFKNNISNIWSFKTALISLFFYGIGYILKNNEILFSKIVKFISNKYILLLLFIFNMYIILLNGRIDMNSSYYSNYFLFLLSALISILIYIVISIKINHSDLLQLIGKSSLLLLGTHLIIFLLTSKYTVPIIYKKDRFNIAYDESSIFFIYIVSALIIIVPYKNILNYFSKIAHKNSLKNTKV
ncbi:acyltransferase family protein [Clostridium intestinale]|uniref:Acyltransferase n=1 Tax=Clostridium intestinale URNW TaxID=1294142 RepID=U2PZX7_9CLOT|nr:acyltransferase family protein [Clostridium intestinale]ERK32040.1 acyltransferase [Clostridium intestinale URNW]